MKIMYFTQEKQVHLQKFYDHFYSKNKITVIGPHSYRKLKGINSFKILGIGFFSKINKDIASRHSRLWLKLVINLRKPDIIHLIGAYSDMLKPLMDMKQDISAPIIVTPAGSEVHSRPWNDEKVYRIVKEVLEKADLIDVGSEFFKDFIIDRFKIPKKKCIVENWGIDIEKCEKISHSKIIELKRKLNIKNDESVILYPKGFRVKEAQNFFHILEAFNILSQKNDKVKLIMLSYGNRHRDNTDEVKKWIKEKELDNRIIVIDEYLTNQEVISLLHIADIMTVFPDVDHLSAVILEGMLCGTIPVLSDIPAYRSYFKDGVNCYYVKQKDSASIEKVLEYCINNKEIILKKIHLRNDELIKKYFDTKRQMAKIEATYRNIIQEK